MYRYHARSLEGFVRQVAVSYVGRGYHHYVRGTLRDGLDPEEIDRKLIEKYDIAISKAERCRRKQAGRAAVQYIRFEREFLLLATRGRHALFDEEAKVIKHVRDRAIPVRGYLIGHGQDPSGRLHPRVQIAPLPYKRLKAYFLELARHRRVETLVELFERFPFEPYAKVRSQMLAIFRAVNGLRERAGFEPVPKTCLPLRLRPIKPFEDERPYPPLLRQVA